MVEWTIAESRHLLAQIVDFAAEYSWLYDFHGTQILDCGVLESLPPGWRNTLTALDAGQLNEIAECQSRSEYPQSMQKFLQSCSELSIHQLLPDASDDLLLEWKVEGVGQKKRYEVPRLTRLVAEVQRRTLSHVVLDIGSGLGYVDSLLHHELGTRVLGVESESQRVLSARARHVRECGRECSHLQYLVWQLRDDKDTVLRASALVEQLLHPARAKEVCSCLKTTHFASESPNSASEGAVVTKTTDCVLPNFASESPAATSKVAVVAGESNMMGDPSSLNETNVAGQSLVDLPEVVLGSTVPESFSLNSVEESVTLLGLHACADLSPTMIRLFMCCNKISSMILLSCCYHKLKPAKLEDSSQECCSKASEDDPEPEAPHLSETSEGYESDVSDECSKLDRSPQTRPKYVSIRKHSSSSQASSHIPSRQQCRRSSDPKCLFKNFPLSRSGSMLMCKRGFSLSVYGLRLACQEPGSRWRRMGDAEHRTHENALLFRAVLDSVCAKHGVDLVKKKRKCANKDQLTSFENYISSVLQCYEIKSPANSLDRSPSNSKYHSSDGDRSSSAEPESNLSDPAEPIGDTPGRLDTSLDSVSLGCSSSSEPKASSSDPSTNQTSEAHSPAFDTEDVSLSRLVPALRQCYSQNQHLGPLLEAITGLQLAMQGVLESFVLLDRVLYALESKFCSSVQLTKVFDASVSPRCAALVLYK